jgi:alkylation response protein AidB-like acyl-CoA dehydrogenase
MNNYSPPVANLKFILNDIMHWDQLFSSPDYAHVDTELGDAVLTAAADFITGVLAPTNQVGDEQGCRLVDGRVVTPDGFSDAYQQYAELGWIGLDMPEAFGGQDLPLILQAAVAEMVNGANVAFGMLTLMGRAAARLLIAHAETELKEQVVPRLVSGEWAATICITEAQAGSDVARIRTMATPLQDRSYSLSGTKIFITFGDQDVTEQICHIVLARTPGATPGTRGLSLFLVPKYHFENGQPNGVSISRLEHKMGLKASPTCVVDFENAEGLLIGNEGEGLKVLFAMVNTMRLEVAIQGVAIAGAATNRALEYAVERTQGGQPAAPAIPIIEHVDVRRMLLIMRSRTEAMRALVLEAACNLDLARTAASTEDRDKARTMADWLLPVCKACCSETGFEVANLAVQVLGGYGYVADYGVEQYVRDSRVMSIYEGANGIQALDLVTRKLARQEGGAYRQFAERIRADLKISEQSPIRDAVASALEQLDHCSEVLLGRLTVNPRDAEAGASAYLALVGLVGGGWMWLRMAGDSSRDVVKQQLAAFYAEYLMAEVTTLKTRVLSTAVLYDGLTTEELIRQ